MPHSYWLLRFYVAALGVGAVLAACVGTTEFVLFRTHPELHFAKVGFVYWVAQASGLVAFAPLTLAWLGANPRDANNVPYPPRSGEKSFAHLSRAKLDVLSVVLIFVLAGGMLLLRVSNDTEYVSPFSLVYIAAVVFCGMRSDALTTYFTLAVAGGVLGVALSFDDKVLSFGSVAAQMKAPAGVFETIVLIFVSTLIAQLLQAVSSDRTESMRRLQDQSTRDSLTGLANESGLGDWLAARDITQSWLIAGVSLSGSRRIGATISPVRLIAIRQGTAQQMRTFGAALTARSDSEHYVLGFPDTTESIAQIAELQQAFNRFEVRNDFGQDISLHGITRVLRLLPGDAPSALLVLASLSTLAARQQLTKGGVVAIHNFNPELQNSLRKQTQRNAQICSWILNNQIELFAQAIHPAQSNSALHAIDLEVLCRLRDDEGKLVLPTEFFQAANQGGLSAQLDRQIITAIFDWFKRRPDALAVTRKCAINLASATLSDPEFIPFIRQLMQANDISAEKFCFEITESNVIDDIDQSRTIVQDLRAAGFRVSIDDFGTGFATYSYLKRYQVDEIKIDGTFVTALGDSAIDIEIVQSIVRVAKMLKVKTVAEFVASDALRRQVTLLGVDFVQGYAIGMPQPIAAMYGVAELQSAAPLSPPLSPSLSHLAAAD